MTFDCEINQIVARRENALPTVVRYNKSVVPPTPQWVRVQWKEVILNCWIKGQSKEWHVLSVHADWLIMVCHSNLCFVYTHVHCSLSCVYSFTVVCFAYTVVWHLLCVVYVYNCTVLNICFCVCVQFDSVDYLCVQFCWLLLFPWAHLLMVGMLRFMSQTYINWACPLFFILFLCLFLSLWSFQLYFIP